MDWGTRVWKTEDSQPDPFLGPATLELLPASSVCSRKIPPQMQLEPGDVACTEQVRAEFSSLPQREQ